ncbi:MAG: hypothetical protein D3906_08935 [Candidatus Electrothrix sp. AUS1_2]|nr:hypothetical protein [Candidatus Electrothrix sp. AUS1_2]
MHSAEAVGCLQIEQGGQTVVSFVLIDINWRASRKMLAYGTVFSRNRGRSCFVIEKEVEGVIRIIAVNNPAICIAILFIVFLLTILFQ